MDLQNKIFFFDFDGVVCDSTCECMVTSFNSWSSYNNTNEFRSKVDEFSSAEIKNFKQLRPYVKGAGDYYILNKFTKNEISSPFNEDSLKIFREKWKSEIKIFKRIF